MNNDYSMNEFEQFARGIKKASSFIASKKPDYIFAPITGSVPFIDLLFIADRHFQLDNVEYPPNSSKFINREEIIFDWYGNFLEKNYFGEPLNIICVDEVVSGSSALKGYNEFQKSLYNFKKKHNESLDKKVSYNVVGIGERPRKGIRNNKFNELVNSKKIHVIDVDKILTMDNPIYNPIKLMKNKNHNGRLFYFPKIEGFCISEGYMNLLKNFASYFGADSSKITIQNLGKINESLEKYLS